MKLHKLICAAYTPFNADGSLNLAAVEKQAAHYLRDGVRAVFVCGTTGESASLTIDERIALANRWSEVVRKTELRLVVHVGTNCLADSRALAAAAQQAGAVAISTLSPTYFKPRSLDLLIDWCTQVAAAAPTLPFYYYDIPTMTGVTLGAADFLEAAQSRIPTLAGLKYTNADLAGYQRCLHAAGGRFDLPYGMDQALLAALSLGAQGAIGSSYNFAAPLSLRLMAAFEKADLPTARNEQFRSVQLIELLSAHGYMGAGKAVMSMLGVDVGPARLPNGSLNDAQRGQLKDQLDKLGFFTWGR